MPLPAIESEALRRIDGEPRKWHHRFVSFALFGPGRSLAQVYLVEAVAMGRGPKKAPKGPVFVPGNWKRAYRAFDWKRRAEAYDDDCSSEFERVLVGRMIEERGLLAGTLAKGRVVLEKSIASLTRMPLSWAGAAALLRVLVSANVDLLGVVAPRSTTDTDTLDAKLARVRDDMARLSRSWDFQAADTVEALPASDPDETN